MDHSDYPQRVVAILRENPDVLAVAFHPCELCGSVVYVSVASDAITPHNDETSQPWEVFWSARSMSDDSAIYSFHALLTERLADSDAVPIVRLVPAHAISAGAQVDAAFWCHGSSSIRSSHITTSPEIDAIEHSWKEALGLPGRVAADDDFFDLGGDSLAAIRVAAVLSNSLKLKVSVRLILTFTIASELADELAALRRTAGGALRSSQDEPK
jgi:acyl carrier protein